jgi:hypothetical protein
MTLATYRGAVWRVAAIRQWPQTHYELETPSGGRCAAPSSQVEIQEVQS